jgi:Winged helix-turn-helix DNA-binding
VADLLTDIRRDIDRRLDELRPVRDEFRRLEQARDALAKADAARRTARASKANDGSTRTRLTRARSQEIDRRVLALLAEDSAQRPAALAMLTETSVGSMNARLNRLVRDGQLKKSRRGKTIRYQVPPGGDRDGH